MTATEGVEFLGKFFGRTLSEEARRYYVSVLLAIPDPALRDATVRRAAEEHGRFPTVAQLRAALRETKAAHWTRTQDRAARAPLTAPPIPPAPELAAASWLVIRARLTGRLSRGEYVARLRALAAAYPGIGWDEAADAVEAWAAGRSVPCAG